MTPIEIALIVFACVFGGTLVGMSLQALTPAHHLSEESKDVIKLGMGLIATIAALVLGLVIASAKSSYDTEDIALKQIAAKALLLDRDLAQYGPEARECRNLMRRIVAAKIDEIWPEERSQPARVTYRSGGCSRRRGTVFGNLSRKRRHALVSVPCADCSVAYWKRAGSYWAARRFGPTAFSDCPGVLADDHLWEFRPSGPA